CLPRVLPAASVLFSPAWPVFAPLSSHAPPSTPPSAPSSARLEPYDQRRKCATSYQPFGREPGGDSSRDVAPRGAEQSPHLWLPSSIQALRWRVRSGGRVSVSSLLIRIVEWKRPGKAGAQDACAPQRFSRVLL